jgi:hypothetical protein
MVSGDGHVGPRQTVLAWLRELLRDIFGLIFTSFVHF